MNLSLMLVTQKCKFASTHCWRLCPVRMPALSSIVGGDAVIPRKGPHVIPHGRHAFYLSSKTSTREKSFLPDMALKVVVIGNSR